MIAGVRGVLEMKAGDSAYVTVSGITLRVFAPVSTIAELQVGETVHFHTYLLVREDALTLFGFAQPHERELFEQMLLVGGVGPRIGLALLSYLSADALYDAVLSEDVARLTLAPGVGKKLAQRMILELRPRFEKMGLPVGSATVSPMPRGGTHAQVVEALTGLGYAPVEATAAVRALPEDATGSLEELIMLALRSLSKE